MTVQVQHPVILDLLKLFFFSFNFSVCLFFASFASSESGTLCPAWHREPSAGTDTLPTPTGWARSLEGHGQSPAWRAGRTVFPVHHGDGIHSKQSSLTERYHKIIQKVLVLKNRILQALVLSHRSENDQSKNVCELIPETK